jgi:D-threo-aldose 1-dehydrogenase
VILPARQIGRTRVTITALGLGGGPLGGLHRAVGEAEAEATCEAAWDGGVRYFDTAPLYGHGLSEHRLGRFLRERPRDEVVVSTKVGRLVARPRDPRSFAPAGPWHRPLPFEWAFDYRHDAILRSFEDSLQRLGTNRVDLVLVHDLEAPAHGGEAGLEARWAQLESGGARALARLRDEGAVDAIGLGVNDDRAVPRALERLELDAVLLAGPYTLADQRGLDEALPACVARGVSVIVGSPFDSGALLAARDTPLAAVCRRYGVEPAAAALQLPLAHPAVASVIPGAAHRDEVRDNLLAMARPIPAELWDELRSEGLLRADAAVPARESAA